MSERRSREEILQQIEERVRQDVAPVRIEGDDDTADFLERELLAYRIAELNALSYINSCFVLPQVLYPGSASDKVPHLVFGERVFHTSLETYRGGDRQYFQDMKGANNLVGDNEQLPFQDKTFNCVLALDAGIEHMTAWNNELIRVLAPRGILLVSNNTFTSNDEARTLLLSSRTDMRLSYSNTVPGDTEKSIEFFGFEKK